MSAVRVRMRPGRGRARHEQSRESGGDASLEYALHSPASYFGTGVASGFFEGATGLTPAGWSAFIPGLRKAIRSAPEAFAVVKPSCASDGLSCQFENWTECRRLSGSS